jgi:Lrp/AsnC family leucine-responsive transcriptional regulator
MIDDIDRRLLSALQDDARLSYAELGRRVGLSAPAVTERVHRLEANGVITGYHAAVDLKAAGLGIVAFVRLSAPAELIAQLERLAIETPEVLELHRVTGSEGHILKVGVESVEHLDRVVRTFLPYGLTTTSIVLSTALTRRRIDFGR